MSPIVVLLAAGCADRGTGSEPPLGTLSPVPQPVPPRAERPCEPGSDLAWQVALEWEWTEVGLDVYRSPVVGNLTDDDDDGEITVDDVPDVAFVAGGFEPHASGAWGPIVVLEGDTGEVRISTGDLVDSAMGVVLADVDADGDSELVVRRYPLTQAPATEAFTGGLATVWKAEWITNDRVTPTVADLDGDGHPEVIDGDAILDGDDGSLVAAFDPARLSDVRPVVTADLDLDGRREIVVGNAVFDADGTHLWSASSGGDGVVAVPVDADSDPEGEVLFSSSSATMELRDTDGSLLASGPLAHSGELAMADIDGDGAPEVIVSGEVDTSAYRLDGTLLWRLAHDSVASAASAFDFDGDGAYEVVAGDGAGFDIIDGRTGTSRIRVDGPVNALAFPVIVDVDNDGSAEILVAGAGVRSYGNPACAWPRAGVGWGLHDFDGTNLAEDGSVPVNEPPIWQGSGNFRARP